MWPITVPLRSSTGAPTEKSAAAAASGISSAAAQIRVARIFEGSGDRPRRPPRKRPHAARRSALRSDGAQGLQPRLRVDLVLAHHHGLAAEALDDRADVGADRWAGEQH